MAKKKQKEVVKQVDDKTIIIKKQLPYHIGGRGITKDKFEDYPGRNFSNQEFIDIEAYQRNAYDFEDKLNYLYHEVGSKYLFQTEKRQIAGSGEYSIGIDSPNDEQKKIICRYYLERKFKIVFDAEKKDILNVINSEFDKKSEIEKQLEKIKFLISQYQTIGMGYWGTINKTNDDSIDSLIKDGYFRLNYIQDFVYGVVLVKIEEKLLKLKGDKEVVSIKITPEGIEAIRNDFNGLIPRNQQDQFESVITGKNSVNKIKIDADAKLICLAFSVLMEKGHIEDKKKNEDLSEWIVNNLKYKKVGRYYDFKISTAYNYVRNEKVVMGKKKGFLSNILKLPRA